MSVNFPTSLDTLTNPTATDYLNSPSHAGQHANANDILEALEAKVGINSSAVTTSHDYKLGEITGVDKAVGKSATQILTNKHIELKAPEGFLLNGKIVPSVSSNNLTVAIKTLAGTDPSATDPVFVRINGVIRSITSAISVTKNAGTNWMNLGGGMFATIEYDLFVYLGYNSTDGVVIGFSRIPFAKQYSDFSTTATNDRYCAISTITNATATDYYTVIGRFSATLSATANYYWSVPTYTAKNLIQRPIYETMWRNYVPNLNGFSGTPTFNYAKFKILYDIVFVEIQTIAGTSNATTFTVGIPIFTLGTLTVPNAGIATSITDNSIGITNFGRVNIVNSTPTIATINKDGASTGWTNSGTKGCHLSLKYPISEEF